jgi:hypothetical protein
MQTQTQEDFKTGIYLEFPSDKLVFAREVVREVKKTGMGDMVVIYNALWPDAKTAHCAEIGEFDAEFFPLNHIPHTRFTLVLPLPVEKMQMLLPGTLVDRLGQSDTLPYKVEETFQQNSEIFVRLSHWNGGCCDLLTLDSLFRLFFKVLEIKIQSAE